MLYFVSNTNKLHFFQTILSISFAQSESTDGISDITKMLLAKIADDTNASKAANTTNQLLRQKTWYDNTFKPAKFDDDSALQVIQTVMLWAFHAKQSGDGTHMSTSLRSRMEHFQTLLEMTKGKPLSTEVTTLISSMTKLLSTEEAAERRQGVSVGWIAMSSQDSLHLFNSILLEHDGDIPDQKLELMHKFLLSQITGRRSGERLFVAAASWQLAIIEKDGKVFRKMAYTFCWLKNHGPGKYYSSFVHARKSGVENQLVVITLILLQRKGMIRSALDVFEGREELDIDSVRFETADDLEKKIRECDKLVKKQNVKRLQGDLDDDEDDSGNSLLIALRKHDEKYGSKIPFYTTYYKGTGFPTSTRFNPNATTMKDFGIAYGYTPKKSLRFGLTSGRKFFRQNSRNKVSSTMNGEAHLNMHLSHNSVIALTHYDNPNEYRLQTPANLMQQCVEEEEANIWMDRYVVTPAYMNPSFFRREHKVLLDPLPGSVEFIRQHARSPVLGGECDGVGCTMSFLYEGDRLQHMRQCNATQFKCPVAGCGKLFVTLNGCRDHVTKKSIHPNYEYNSAMSNKDKLPPKGVHIFWCPCCPRVENNWFRTQRGQDKHLKKNHRKTVPEEE